MKRFFTLLAVISMTLVAMAQHPMVTLSHNGQLSFFTNLTAFEAALDSAKNGDTLYLSEGEFLVTGGALTIKKRVSIVGNGYGSHIVGDLTINMGSNRNSAIDAPLFDGVRLDNLYFANGSDSYVNLAKSEIRRCWIRVLNSGGYAGKDVLFDKCYIESANFQCYSSNSSTVLVKNSKLDGTGNNNDFMYNITAINCNISNAYYYPTTMISCVFRKRDGTEPNVGGSTCSIINSVLDFAPTNSKIYTHDCYIYSAESQPLLDDKLNCPLDLKQLGYLGQDGTVAGIDGGETPFSENPSVPTVDTAKSSVQYDATSNKLKVNITVKAD